MARSQSNVELTVGLDLGDRNAHVCVVDSDGKKVKEDRIALTANALGRFFRGKGPWRVALEVGTHSPWVSEALREYGHHVIVANARKVRLIAKSDRKSDRVDAEMLARIARLDPQLLCPIRHRGAQARADLALLRSRDLLVASRTSMVSHVRSTVKSFGHRLPSCSADSFHKIPEEQLPESVRHVLFKVLEQIEVQTRAIKAMDKEIERLSRERYPETSLLRQVHGVGPVTALCFVLTLEDPRRFKKSRQVGPYLGLVPRQRDSGRSSPQLRITKAGDIMLRRLLVSCAQYILGPFGTDSDLRRWGLKLATVGGSNGKKRAVVAVARKLATLLHHLWKTGEILEPLRGQEPATRPRTA